MTKVLLTHIVTIEQEIDLPDNCPNCDAKLTEDDALRRYDYDMRAYNGRLGKPGFDKDAPIEFLAEGSVDEIVEDSIAAHDYWCASCDEPIATGQYMAVNCAEPNKGQIDDAKDLIEAARCVDGKPGTPSFSGSLWDVTRGK